MGHPENGIFCRPEITLRVLSCTESVLDQMAAQIGSLLDQIDCLNGEIATLSGLTCETAVFGAVEGKDVHRFTLKNAHGLEVNLISFGAFMQSCKFPDSKGNSEELTVNFGSLSE